MLSDDYVCLHENNLILIKLMTLTPSNEAVSCSESNDFVAVIQEKLKSVQDNDVLDLVDLPCNFKPIGCK